jgi:2-hydroxychromene-2-carboxylate isomerase
VRVVTYIYTNYGADLMERSLVSIWEAYWTQGLDISSRQVIEDSLRPIFPDTSQLEAVLEGAITGSNKAKVRETTDSLMKGGCFGAPWFVATNSDGGMEQFWGNDRWDHIFQHLDIPFTPVHPLLPENPSQLHWKL